MLDRGPVKRLPMAEAVEVRQIKLEDLRSAHYRAIKKLVDFKLIAKSQTAGLLMMHCLAWGRAVLTPCWPGRPARSRH